MSPYYFDYNSTSPLSLSVIKRLQKGEVDFFNPSALHKLGRESQKQINQTSSKLLDIFNLKESHSLFYHSGATEGINTIFSSHLKQNPKALHIGFETDHASVKKTIESLGAGLLCPVKSCGDLDLKSLENIFNAHKDRDILINWTWSHNETGVVWPLADIVKLKEKHNFQVHIDAAQVVGKIDDWTNILSECDYISFSGHKFGSLKGVGFTFYSNEISIHSYIHGGGQQKGLRSGTMNTLGVVSLVDALEDRLDEKDRLPLVNKAKNRVISEIISVIANKGQVICQEARYKNNNTFTLILNDYPSDRSFPYFDIDKLVIGRGAACSSGAKKPSETLLALGYVDHAENGLRFSFEPMKLLENEKEYLDKIKNTLSKILST